MSKEISAEDMKKALEILLQGGKEKAKNYSDNRTKTNKSRKSEPARNSGDILLDMYKGIKDNNPEVFYDEESSDYVNDMMYQARDTFDDMTMTDKAFSLARVQNNNGKPGVNYKFKGSAEDFKNFLIYGIYLYALHSNSLDDSATKEEITNGIDQLSNIISLLTLATDHDYEDDEEIYDDYDPDDYDFDSDSEGSGIGTLEYDQDENGSSLRLNGKHLDAEDTAKFKKFMRDTFGVDLDK